ncbi:inner membrane protein YhjD [Terrabacter aerolatus]|uniref:Inner membrane protein YhjD n=1 Tax=Terrabacter aerolatus TaxID=422442 RepID=A0A512CZN2_9MICO|nr:YihY/virulence factor BrkB family protein [Terrabacter aerolatus]GEO29671.1 inner membrane protein YhjD [Terrabacter aerolatus]
MSVIQTVLDRLRSTRGYRAWTRYGEANGDLLAAGVGYFAFFSIFPALALAFAVFGFVLRGRPDLVETIAESLNATLPGMVKTASHPEGIISVRAPASLTLTITGIVSFVTLLLAGLGWVGALRTGIRGVFGLEASTDNMVRTKARDVFVLLTLGLAIAVSAILTSAIGGLAERVAGWIGLGGNGFLVGLLGLLAGVVFDTLILVVLLRMLSGVPLPLQDVRQGAVLGAVILTVLKLFGGFLVSHATSNPLLGAVAVAVGLLFWLNLMSKVILLSAAWTANESSLGRPDADLVRYAAEPVRTETGTPAHAGSQVTHVVPEASTGAGRDASRAMDRASLAAGAVLGAFAVSAVRGVGKVRRH